MNKNIENIEILKNYLREFKKISIIDSYIYRDFILFNIDKSDYEYKIYIKDYENIIIELIDREDNINIEIFKFNYLSFSYNFDFSENRIKNIFKNYIMNLIDFE